MTNEICMKTIVTFLVNLFVLMSLTGTLYAQRTEEEIKRELAQKEAELLKKEIELLKSELKATQNGNATTTITNTPVVTPSPSRNIQPVIPASPNSSTASSTGTNSSTGTRSNRTSSSTAGTGSSTRTNPSAAQDVEKRLDQLAFQILDEVASNRSGKPELAVTSQSENLIPLINARIVSKETITKGTLDVEAARTDKRLGADAKSSGTTTLVSKGGIPLIFSLATEHGAAVSTTSGTSITFHFNPVGLTDYLRNLTTQTDDNFSIVAPPDNRFRRFWRRTSFGLTFDTSRGVETPTFTGSREQLSQISFRHEFLKKRNPTRAGFAAATQAFTYNYALKTSKQQFDALTALLSENSPTFRNQSYLDWEAITNTKLAVLQLKNKNGSLTDLTVIEENKKAIADVVVQQLDVFPVEEFKKDQSSVAAFAQWAAAEDVYEKAKEDYLRRLSREQQFTFEYINNRELNAPDSSNVRLIFERGTSGGVDFTFNGSFTAFHSRPSNPVMLMMPAQTEKFKRLRDFSFATQMDLPLGDLVKNGTFSLAAKYQRMNTDAFVFNNMIFTGIKGDILAAQAKLNLGLGKSGFFLPLSLTYANRSELIKEKKSRGNFGFTVDASSFLERLLNLP
jgi:hypothetical protein